MYRTATLEVRTDFDTDHLHLRTRSRSGRLLDRCLGPIEDAEDRVPRALEAEYLFHLRECGDHAMASAVAMVHRAAEYFAGLGDPRGW